MQDFPNLDLSMMEGAAEDPSLQLLQGGMAAQQPMSQMDPSHLEQMQQQPMPPPVQQQQPMPPLQPQMQPQPMPQQPMQPQPMPQPMPGGRIERAEDLLGPNLVAPQMQLPNGQLAPLPGAPQAPPKKIAWYWWALGAVGVAAAAGGGYYYYTRKDDD